MAMALTGCSVRDSLTAIRAEKGLIGLSEVDLESCMGVPNRRDIFNQTMILSYDGNSTSSGGMSLTLPIVGSINFSGGGYCHMNVRIDSDRVTEVHYLGETDAPMAPEAYCAPLVRSCMKSLPAPPADRLNTPAARPEEKPAVGVSASAR